MVETRNPDGKTPAKHAVAFYGNAGPTGMREHERKSKMSVARSLADLLGIDFIGEIDEPGLRNACAASPLYVVPSDTLDSLEHAATIGIQGPDDFFGGVVPSPFMATKVITHPLARLDAAAPAGWSPGFCEHVRDVVLPGFSVFSLADARSAGARMLESGDVRVKQATGVGGSGQAVVADLPQLHAHLAAIDDDACWRHGVVLEQNLSEAETYSVGQVRTGRWLASYVGTQALTRNHGGEEVYGGSTLRLVRGGFAELLQLDLGTKARTAVEQAMRYHAGALHSFAGMFASRSNYDVVQGRDERGRWCSGVLEQSWRIGGASGAEIAALHAFAADPTLCCVQASTHEVYAHDAEAPVGAQVHFDGIDPAVGRLLKFAQVKIDVDA